MVTEAHGVSMPNTSANTGKRGMKITTGGTAFSLISITKSSLSAATVGYLYASDHSTLIAQANFSGNTATFAAAQNLSASTTYYLLTDGGGSNVDGSYGEASFPIAGTYLNWVAGYNTADTSTECWSVESCEITVATNVTVSPSTITAAFSIYSPTISAGVDITISPNTLTMSFGLSDPTITAVQYIPSHVVVGTGSVGTRFVEKNYPYEKGLTAGTTYQDDMDLTEE